MFRVVDLLTSILELHADVLLKMRALFGEEVLVEILERAGAKREESDTNTGIITPVKMNLRKGAENQSECLAELELIITKMKLPERLEFYLWGYPQYRTIIESDVDISAVIHLEPDESDALIQDAWNHTQSWLKSLGMADTFYQRVEREAQVSWNSFRLKTLRKMGQKLTLASSD